MHPKDRIPDQLMFVPPGLPDNQDDPTVPLKKILLWNGISSWGGLRAGRGEFLRQQCPVNTCVITSSRTEAKGSNKDYSINKEQFLGITYYLLLQFLLGMLLGFFRIITSMLYFALCRQAMLLQRMRQTLKIVTRLKFG